MPIGESIQDSTAANVSGRKTDDTMPASIATINNRPMIAYQDESPWHRLGTSLPPGQIDVQTALDAAGLNWNVQLHPMYLQDGRQVDERFATIRDTDGAILGTVGPNYTAIQNSEAGAILDDVCREYGVGIKTVGALDNGATVWMLASMNQQIEPVPGDINKGFVLLSWNHAGLAALTGRGTLTRVVCRNTLDMAVNGSRSMFSIRHTASAQDRMAEARRLMNYLTKNLQQAGKTYADLAHQSLTREQLAAFINAVVPMPPAGKDGKPSKVITERRDTLAMLMHHGTGMDIANQAVPAGQVSAWGAYNAITEYFDHVRPAEAKSDSAKASANQSAIFGAGAAAKRTALDALLEMVPVAAEPARLIA